MCLIIAYVPSYGVLRAHVCGVFIDNSDVRVIHNLGIVVCGCGYDGGIGSVRHIGLLMLLFTGKYCICLFIPIF